MYLINALVAIHLSQLVLLAVVVEQLDGLIKEDDQSSVCAMLLRYHLGAGRAYFHQGHI